MCTALADATHVRQAVAAGCAHYLVKPIRRPDLLRRVQEVLSNTDAVMDTESDIVKRFGIDESEFQAIAADFRDLLVTQVELLESVPDQTEVDESSLGLGALHESATIFGAKRLASVLPSATDTDEPTNRQLIVKEMQSVILALPARQDGGAAS